MDTAARHTLLQGQQAWLWVSAATTLAPHGPYLPPWLGVTLLVLMAAQAWRLWRLALPPPRWFVALLAVAAIAGVLATYRHFFGKDPGVALLAVLLVLKLIEARNPRDGLAAVLLALFLQTSQFLNGQSLAIGALALVGALLALGTLANLQVVAPPRPTLRLAGALMLQGLPFMLVLFLLFPRVEGPLWGMPADAFSARSGLSDRMSPGAISELVRSDAIAFRAEFRGPPPPPHQRYWRGPVLHRFDGETWHPGPDQFLLQPNYQAEGPAFPYQLTLEPHQRTWLLAMDFPADGLPFARYTADYRLVTRQPLRTRQRFDLVAFPETSVGRELPADALAEFLQLPERGNPRTRALGRELRGRGNPEAILAAAMAEFRRSGLVYTLRPPLLTGDTVDGFLFDTRRGFCEHFASAFTFLLRTAGLPARVVTGYQGGEINPVNQILEVRQSDAHAWSEAWLPGRGWIRVDPTALAAPARTEGNLARALDPSDPIPFMWRSDGSWLRHLRHQWDALNNHWNQFVLGYTGERQLALLSRLGFDAPDWRNLAWLLVAGVGGLFGALLLWAHHRSPPKDPAARAWDLFCRRLARAGLPRLPWEGPLAYADRAALRWPDLAAEIRAIARDYTRLRYGAEVSTTGLKPLHRRIHRLKPK
ncbi:MAG: DUF3488 domain-containing transglutaminase family protein [Zoogloeaceae bacterium]|nr:DUF3488 domain-containing transglutaminase family protein [Zoogloeaceae bacterium]